AVRGGRSEFIPTILLVGLKSDLHGRRAGGSVSVQPHSGHRSVLSLQCTNQGSGARLTRVEHEAIPTRIRCLRAGRVPLQPCISRGRPSRDQDRKSTRLTSHVKISYAVFCLKKKKK